MDAPQLSRPRSSGPIAYSRPPARPYHRLRYNECPDIGAHLITPWLGFAHHGIYVGHGKVIHYGALVYDLIRRPVEEVTLQQFGGGRPVFVVQHEALAFSVEEILHRARSRIGENRYRLMSNNCEHFVEWCLYDVHRSFQVERALEFPRMMGERIQNAVARFIARLFRIRRPAVNSARVDPPNHPKP
jgi:hypothetical protein